MKAEKKELANAFIVISHSKSSCSFTRLFLPWTWTCERCYLWIWSSAHPLFLCGRTALNCEEVSLFCSFGPQQFLVISLQYIPIHYLGCFFFHKFSSPYSKFLEDKDVSYCLNSSWPTPHLCLLNYMTFNWELMQPLGKEAVIFLPLLVFSSSQFSFCSSSYTDLLHF